MLKSFYSFVTFSTLNKTQESIENFINLFKFWSMLSYLPKISDISMGNHQNTVVSVKRVAFQIDEKVWASKRGGDNVWQPLGKRRKQIP